MRSGRSVSRHRSSESPAGTTVPDNATSINASPTPGTAGSGNILTITTGAQIAVNGTTIGGSGVIRLFYDSNHTAWQENSVLDWWEPITATGTGSGPFTDPRPVTLSNVTLSNTSFISGSPTGTVVGAIGVTMSSGTFTGTLSLTGTNASSFQLSSTTLPSNLLTLGVQSSPSYSINIVATQAGATGSPKTVLFTITSSVSTAKVIFGTEAAFHGAPTIAAQNTALASTGQTIRTIEEYMQQGWAGFFDSEIIQQIPPASGGFPMMAISPNNSGSLLQTYTDVTNGTVDANINNMFTTFKNAGYTQMCIRPLWEWNINGGMSDTSLQTPFMNAFAHIANLAYAFAGMKIYTIFNPGSGNGGPTGGPSTWYPGDAFVDWIGIDESANWDSQGTYSNPLNLTVSPSYTIGGCATFAVQRGKPVAVCEGGVANSAQTTATGANSENFSTTLNGAITASQTSVVVASATGLPAVPFPIQIGSEWLNVTGKSGTTLTINGTPGSGGTGRGYNGTTAASHTSGTAVTYGGYCAWLCNIMTAMSQTGAKMVLFGYYNGTDVGTSERWDNVAADTTAVLNFTTLCPIWTANLSTTGH